MRKKTNPYRKGSSPQFDHGTKVNVSKGKIIWVRSENEFWAGSVVSEPGPTERLRVWWMGPTIEGDLTGVWVHQVDPDTRKPLISLIHCLSVFSNINFLAGNILGDNHPGVPPPVVESDPDEGSDADADFSDAPEDPPIFKSRDFFNSQLQSQYKASQWARRYAHIHIYISCIHPHATHIQIHKHTGMITAFSWTFNSPNGGLPVSCA